MIVDKSWTFQLKQLLHTHTCTLEWTRRTYIQQAHAHFFLLLSGYSLSVTACSDYTLLPQPQSLTAWVRSLVLPTARALSLSLSLCVRSLRSCALSILLTPPSPRLRLLALAYSVDSALCCCAVRSSPAITHRALHTHTHTHTCLYIYLNSSVIYITVNAAKPTTWHNVEILWL